MEAAVPSNLPGCFASDLRGWPDAEQVLEASGQLLEIAAAYESAYQPTAEVSGEREFTPVLAAALDPLLSACERSAASLQRQQSGRCSPLTSGLLALLTEL